MSRVVRVVFRNGEHFFAEVDDGVVAPTQSSTEFEPTSKRIQDLGVEFEDLKKLIIACSNGLFDCFDDIPKAKKITAEFGAKLVGEAGVPALAKLAGEASVKVSIEWDTSDDKSK